MRREILFALVFTLGCQRSAPPALTTAAVTEPPPTHATAPTQEPAADADTTVAVVDASTASPATPVAVAPPTTGARPLEYDRAITPDDLRGRTLRELALMRNMPYARHGQRFRRPWLASYFSEQSWYHASHFVQSSELAALERQNSDAVAHYDVALERADLVRMRDALLQRQREHHLRPEDNVEAMLIGTRLGERIGGDGLSAVDPQVTPLEDPTRLDALLTLEMLRVLSPRDLRILRNMVRARHGATFHAASLVDYFEPAEWYHPDPAYNDARLTRVDRQNLRLIQTVEAEIGGPITERQIQDEDMSGA